jgi:hypothetical protein
MKNFDSLKKELALGNEQNSPASLNRPPLWFVDSTKARRVKLIRLFWRSVKFHSAS